MLFVTMKAHHRKTGRSLLILGMDSRRAVTIDDDGNLAGYYLRELKASALEAQLRMAIDTKGVEGLLDVVSGNDELGFEITK